MSIKAKDYYVLIGFFCLSIYSAFTQNQKLADSLIAQYNSRLYKGSELEILKIISEEETNSEKILEFSELLIEKAYKDSSFYFLHNGFLQKGNALLNKGNNVEALQAFLKSLEYAGRINDENGVGALMISIADTYTRMDNPVNANVYYNRGIAILRKVNDSIQLASALLNAGDFYFNNKKYDDALQNFEESGIIFKKVDYLIGTAYNLGNVGMVYAEQGKDALAEKYINEAIEILEKLEDYYPISVYLTYMADIYVKKGDLKTAFDYAQRSLDLASQYGLKEQIGDANFKLYELHNLTGNKDLALDHYKNYIMYRDSIKNIESVQKMADLRTDYEVSQKQVEVDLLNEQKKTQRIIVYATALALFLIVLLAIGLFKRNKFVRATNKIIAAEKERSENLLLNILPEETAQELKDNGKVEAKRFESVTVLFTDFKGFTSFAEHLSPEELVNTVDFYFSKFDEIMEHYELEKIKTVGDAYMCAGGLPFPTEDHAIKMVNAALEIIEFVKNAKNSDNQIFNRFEIRIGINTGPVVAGVVGSKKFAYDIWGDTVNIASRMEANSETGKINISESTYIAIKDHFNCTFRGEMEVKNRGYLKMYFVENPN
jgi:class 3 adenylate cyclase/Tfp pilus assembly protein PilF